MEEQNQDYDQQSTVIVNQAPKNGSGMAIASMVLGILAIVFSCCGACVSVVLGIVGLVLGIVSVVQNYQGKNMAIAGIVMCSIGIVFGIAITVLAMIGSAFS